jgi:hypothetical protein
VRKSFVQDEGLSASALVLGDILLEQPPDGHHHNAVEETMRVAACGDAEGGPTHPPHARPASA